MAQRTAPMHGVQASSAALVPLCRRPEVLTMRGILTRAPHRRATALQLTTLTQDVSIMNFARCHQINLLLTAVTVQFTTNLQSERSTEKVRVLCRRHRRHRASAAMADGFVVAVSGAETEGAAGSPGRRTGGDAADAGADAGGQPDARGHPGAVKAEPVA